MMTLLVNLDILDAGNPTDSDEKYIAAIARMFSSVYENSEQNKNGAYIKGVASVQLGRTNTQAIKNLAANWNDTLVQTTQKLMDELPDPDEWPGNDKIGQLADAARELADDWTPFADHGIYTANEFGNEYFKTVLAEDDLHAITENPEDWAIVTIFPE